MELHRGFVNPQFPKHVCKLSKALYGLKEAHRAWFQRLSTFLTTYNYTWPPAINYLLPNMILFAIWYHPC